MDDYEYTCPSCGGTIVHEQFDYEDTIMCPHCGAGPFENEHECNEDGCADWLSPVEKK